MARVGTEVEVGTVDDVEVGTRARVRTGVEVETGT